jgi:excinuclease ABC subunit C
MLQDKLKKLPKSPGVYFHKSAKGEIIYVGKAAVLRNRMRQYFQKSRNRDPKTEALVAEIKDIEWIEVESELDALFLEAELIKRYKPRFNIALRDDKSDLFVRIDAKTDHPTVSYTRRPLDDGADYYGPFQNPGLLRRAMKLMRRVFPYDQKKPISKKVTLDYHIGLSPGLEEGKTSLEEYRKNLKYLVQYLKGNRVKIITELESEMKKAARLKEFEKAAQLRNQVYALKALKKQIVFSDKEFMDISKDQALNGLAELLNLSQAPRRIEGYDISHMSGADNVASMVVFTNGLPNKREYRKFKMRLKGNDDFAHMREVMTRRFSAKNMSAWQLPDLILIDGGKGQLSSALGVLEELGVKIPAIGLAKKYERIIVKTDGGFNEIDLPNSSHIVKLLQRIRDESHRFAVSYHSTLKTARQTASLLDDIPTIGPATRKKLIKQFGSLRGVIQARQIELESVVGEKKAKILKQYLRPYKK